MPKAVHTCGFVFTAYESLCTVTVTGGHGPSFDAGASRLISSIMLFCIQLLTARDRACSNLCRQSRSVLNRSPGFNVIASSIRDQLLQFHSGVWRRLRTAQSASAANRHSWPRNWQLQFPQQDPLEKQTVAAEEGGKKLEEGVPVALHDNQKIRLEKEHCIPPDKAFVPRSCFTEEGGAGFCCSMTSDLEVELDFEDELESLDEELFSLFS